MGLTRLRLQKNSFGDDLRPQTDDRLALDSTDPPQNPTACPSLSCRTYNKYIYKKFTYI